MTKLHSARQPVLVWQRITKRVATLGLAYAALLAPAAMAEPIIKDGWNNWTYGANQLSFNGYVRSTLGTDLHGHVMAAFQAPNTQSKYRLGNESDTNMELALDYKHFFDGQTNSNGRYLQLFGMLSDYQVNNRYGDLSINFDNRHIAQLYVKAGNVLGDGVSLWFGRRYYDRRDIHMNDHFWLNAMQGAHWGGGVEGVPLWGHRLDVALIQARDTAVADRNGSAITGKLNAYTLDMRYRDIKAWQNGALTLWGQTTYRPGTRKINYSDAYGFALGGWNTQEKVLGGRMVTALTLRQGASMVQGTFNAKAIREDQGYRLGDAYAIELNNDLLWDNPKQNYSLQWATVLRREDFGLNGNRTNWASTGVRPIYYITNHLGLASELGIDYSDNSGSGQGGFLTKGTVALQYTNDRGYFSRPVARLFMTGATWSDDFKGSVGSAPGNASFSQRTSGLTFGAQFEWWW